METEELITLDSYSLGNRFANSCPICSKNIVYQQSFALCNCPIFYHKDCFISHIDKKNIKKQPKIKCLFCQQLFNVSYTIQGQIECKTKMNNDLIITFLTFLISFGAAIFFSVKSISLMQSQNLDNNKISFLYFIGMIVSIIVSVIFVAILIVNYCFKETMLVSVKQINRSIEFSAFKDIGTTQEHTNCMILH